MCRSGLGNKNSKFAFNKHLKWYDVNECVCWYTLFIFFNSCRVFPVVSQVVGASGIENWQCVAGSQSETFILSIEKLHLLITLKCSLFHLYFWPLFLWFLHRNLSQMESISLRTNLLEIWVSHHLKTMQFQAFPKRLKSKLYDSSS